MARIKKGLEFLPGVSSKELQDTYATEKDNKAKMRLLCAIHRKKGSSIYAISSITCIPKSTVSDHLRRIAVDIKRRYDLRNQRRPPKLSERQQSELFASLTESPDKVGYPAIMWTTNMVKHFISERYGISYTPHGVRKLLYRAGFTRIRPRPYHAKGNEKEQEEFKKKSNQRLIAICRRDMRSSFWMKRDSS